MHVFCASMKNLTLRLDEDKLRQARKIAAERATSVNALVRDYLDDLIARESRQETARRELAALCRGSQAVVGEARWTRDSLYPIGMAPLWLRRNASRPASFSVRI